MPPVGFPSPGSLQGSPYGVPIRRLHQQTLYFLCGDGYGLDGVKSLLHRSGGMNRTFTFENRDCERSGSFCGSGWSCSRIGGPTGLRPDFLAFYEQAKPPNHYGRGADVLVAELSGWCVVQVASRTRTDFPNYQDIGVNKGVHQRAILS